MSLFDTHAHLTEDDTDPAAYLQRAVDAGVNEILLNSGTLENACRIAAFAAASGGDIYYAAGIHPHDTEASLNVDTQAFRQFADDPRFLALGELGLDYYYDFSPRELQKKRLAEFLLLALDMAKPVILHCRDKEDCDSAYQDMYDLVKPFAEAGGRFELHSFAGSVAWLERFAALDAWFGVGGMLTFKRAENIRQVVARMDKKKIMLETDAPYLTPVPFRGKVNHPAYLPYTAKALADLLWMPEAEVAALTTENAHAFLKIGGAV